MFSTVLMNAEAQEEPLPDTQHVMDKYIWAYVLHYFYDHSSTTGVSSRSSACHGKRHLGLCFPLFSWTPRPKKSRFQKLSMSWINAFGLMFANMLTNIEAQQEPLPKAEHVMGKVIWTYVFHCFDERWGATRALSMSWITAFGLMFSIMLTSTGAQQQHLPEEACHG